MRVNAERISSAPVAARNAAATGKGKRRTKRPRSKTASAIMAVRAVIAAAPMSTTVASTAASVPPRRPALAAVAAGAGSIIATGAFRTAEKTGPGNLRSLTRARAATRPVAGKRVVAREPPPARARRRSAPTGPRPARRCAIPRRSRQARRGLSRASSRSRSFGRGLSRHFRVGLDQLALDRGIQVLVEKGTELRVRVTHAAQGVTGDGKDARRHLDAHGGRGGTGLHHVHLTDEAFADFGELAIVEIDARHAFDQEVQLRDLFALGRKMHAGLHIAPYAGVQQPPRQRFRHRFQPLFDEIRLFVVEPQTMIDQENARNADEADHDPTALNDRRSQVEIRRQAYQHKYRGDHVEERVAIAAAPYEPELQSDICAEVDGHAKIPRPVIQSCVIEKRHRRPSLGFFAQ